MYPVVSMWLKKELRHKQMDWYKHCSSFSWFYSSFYFGYQIRS